MVNVGSRIVLLDLDENTEIEYEIGKDISAGSAMGQALIGRTQGEVVEVDLPEDKGHRRYEILAVD